MKRKIFAILLSISFSAIALAGCGSKKVEDVNQKVEITATPVADEEDATVKDELASVEPTEAPTVEPEETELPIDETKLPIDNSQLEIETTPEPTVAPTEEPEATELPIDNSQLPIVTEAPKTTEKPVVTEAPKATNTPAPTQLPIDNSPLPIETATPQPQATPVPTEAPTQPPTSELSPTPSALPVEPTATPIPTVAPTPAPTATPEPECEHAGLQLTGRILRREQWAVGRCHMELQWFELYCPNCGITFEDPNPTGCNPEHPTTENPGSYDATCTTDGYYAGKQCDCGQSKLDPYTIPAFGHRYKVQQVGEKFHPGEELYPDDPAMAAISGWTEWHYTETCQVPGCGHVLRDWWSTNGLEHCN